VATNIFGKPRETTLTRAIEATTEARRHEPGTSFITPSGRAYYKTEAGRIVSPEEYHRRVAAGTAPSGRGISPKTIAGRQEAAREYQRERYERKLDTINQEAERLKQIEGEKLDTLKEQIGVEEKEVSSLEGKIFEPTGEYFERGGKTVLFGGKPQERALIKQGVAPTLHTAYMKKVNELNQLKTEYNQKVKSYNQKVESIKQKGETAIGKIEQYGDSAVSVKVSVKSPLAKAVAEAEKRRFVETLPRYDVPAAFPVEV